MKIDIKYIAGFVDGEGCIYASRLSDIKLALTNTHLETLEEIQEYFGVGKIRLKSRSKKDIHTKVCYLWEVWARDCEKVLTELAPYLRQKQEQALLALDFLKLMRRKGEVGYVKKVSDDNWKQREYIQNKLKELKRA